MTLKKTAELKVKTFLLGKLNQHHISTGSILHMPDDMVTKTPQNDHTVKIRRIESWKGERELGDYWWISVTSSGIAGKQLDPFHISSAS